MAAYILLPMRRWSAPVEWTPFPLGERTQWRVVLRTALVSPGGSMVVKLEVSPTGDEDDWTTLATFPQVTAVGETVLDASANTPAFSVVPRRDVWMRATVSSVAGEVAAEVTAEAPFLNTGATEDLALLSQGLREWQDGLARILLRAEQDIIGGLEVGDDGRLELDLTHPDVHKLLLLEIAEQAEHLKRREILSRSHEPSAMVTLRQMPRLYSGVGQRLRHHRPTRSFVWRGR